MFVCNNLCYAKALLDHGDFSDDCSVALAKVYEAFLFRPLFLYRFSIASDCDFLTFACMQGMQWPHASVFPIADLLRSALTVSTCTYVAVIRVFLLTNLLV